MTLSLVGTEALIDELLKRFDHAVFAGQVNHSTKEDQEFFRASGNRRMCQGLCEGAIGFLERQHLAEAEPVKDDGEAHT